MSSVSRAWAGSWRYQIQTATEAATQAPRARIARDQHRARPMTASSRNSSSVSSMGGGERFIHKSALFKARIAWGGTSLSGAKGVIYRLTTPFVPQGVPPNSLTYLGKGSSNTLKG